MAITVAMRTEITQLYVALFGRAPDSEGLGFWVGLRNSGQSMTQIANTMYATAPARDYFPTWMTNGEIIASFYVNVLGRTADAEGLAFWTGKLNAAGATPGSVITQMITNVATYTGTDPNGILSAKLFNNSVQVAQYYAEHGGGIANAGLAIDGVTDQTSSVTAAIAAINAGSLGMSSTMNLTTGLDVLSGAAVDNTFMARVVQNVNGEQTNQLATGDQLNGGAGNDSLHAKVIAASALNQGAYMAITPETVDVEDVLVTALTTYSEVTHYNDREDGEQVVLNAKYMWGLDRVGSVQSDASLVVSNLTTLMDTGDYATRRNTEDVTIRMDHTGNGDSVEPESDLTVLFDQDYLLAGRSTNSRAFYWILDEQAELANNPDRLNRIDVDGLRFTIDGGPIITIKNLAAFFANQMTTHDKFVAALQGDLAAQIASGTIPAGTTLTVETAFTDNTGLDDGSISKPIPAIVLTLTNGQKVVPVGFDRVAELIGNYDVYGQFTDKFLVEDLPVTATIELLKVGRAGDGGELTVGGMSTDGALSNIWDSGSGAKGVEQFNITLEGDDTQDSSLSGLQSTNNTLEIVNIDSAAGSKADLTIGNSETTSGLVQWYNYDISEWMYSWVGLGEDLSQPVWQKVGNVIEPSIANREALKDVRMFDATGMNADADLTLYAALTDEVVPKYMNLMDAAPAGAPEDNVQFVYSGGAGNDYINLWISASNLAAAGTTTREDFVLTINGGAGNDELIAMIGDGSGEDSTGLQTFLPDNQPPVGPEFVQASIIQQGEDVNHWYYNSKVNANLNMNGQAGNDTLRTLGSGDWKIDAGTGNDTVYADNTGMGGGEDADMFNDGKAIWVWNTGDLNGVFPSVTRSTEITNLLTDSASSVSAVNAQLAITFMGFTSAKISIANSVGSNVNVTITDLSINQAIKAAINLDPVLSKLLVAEDGPARTLVVRSLIDGYMNDKLVDPTDQISLKFTTPVLAANQTAAGLVLFDAAATAKPTLLDAFQTNPLFATHGKTTLRGGDSDNVADNRIEGDLGNDVIVLGTGHFSNDTLVYQDFKNGTDSIVNFDDRMTTGYSFWDGGEDEVITLTFSASDGSPVAETILFDGKTVTLSAPVLMGVIPATDVAFQFYEQWLASSGSANWDIVSWNSSNQVKLQHKSPGVVTDVVPADFTGTYFGAANGNGTVLVTTNFQGADIAVPGSYTAFKVDFDTMTTAASVADQFLFDTVAVPYAIGDGSVTLVNKILAQSVAFATAGWTVAPVSGDPTAVTFTETGAHAATPIGTNAQFDLGTNNIFGTITGTVGVADTTRVPVLTVVPAGPDIGFDMIDFSWYKPTGVIVTDTNQAGVIVAGTANGVATKWITMTESTTNDGEYTINLVTSTIAGTADDAVSLIGIADFGYEQDFVTQTFILV